MHSKDSDWSDAQADLSVSFAQTHFVGFVRSLLKKAALMFFQSKEEGKDQESIQSSTTPDPGYQWES